MWPEQDIKKICKHIDKMQNEMVKLQIGLSAIPALSPINKGIGEIKKSAYLKKELKRLGFGQVEEYRAPDKDTPCGYRPSLITRIKGKNHSKTIWIISHTDIVPPGARNLWNTDPYKAVVKDGKIFGRGTEDNQQAIVTSIFAAKAMKDLKLVPEYDIALGFLADEETGSHFGIRWLLDHKKLFRKQDIIIVPDGGREDSMEIIIAEKAILWLKFTVKGKQCHASRPDQGINAHRAGAELICQLDNLLHKKFNLKNRLFNPSLSTFEPTMKSANVENVNTIPGEDVFYFDCRILPKYTTAIVKKTARQEADKIEKKYRVKITIEPVNESDSSYTPESAEAVRMLSGAIQHLKGKKPALVGMGGGTFAAHFRQSGFPAVVWSTLGERAHQPNEYCLIKNMITDTKVFAYLFSGR